MELLEQWEVLVAILGAGVLAGFIQSAIGFGFGLVAIAILPLVIDGRLTHLLVSLSSVVVMAAAAYAYRRGTDLRLLGVTLLGAAIFVPVGLLLFDHLPADSLVRGTGAMVLLVAVRELAVRRAPDPDRHGGGSMLGFGAGAIAGFLAGAVTIAGPPIAAFAATQPWPQQKFKAFVIQFLLAVSLFKAVGLLVGGFVDGTVVLGAAVVLPGAIAGIWAGAHLTRRLSTRRFRMLVAAALVVIALILIVRGAPEEPETATERHHASPRFAGSDPRSAVAVRANPVDDAGGRGAWESPSVGPLRGASRSTRQPAVGDA